MIIEGEFRFAGPRDTVWDLLQDPGVLVKALPGARELTRTAEAHFQGTMVVGVGPVTAGEFAVTVTLGDKRQPSSFSMQVEGKGAVGFARGTARVDLEEPERGATLMHYRADLQIGGKIAGVGQRVIDAAARLMTRQGLEALNRELVDRLAVTPQAGAAADVAAAPGGRFRAGHFVTGIFVVLGALLFTCGITA
jgi:carbon monoxide dehydrogenase subunit G